MRREAEWAITLSRVILIFLRTEKKTLKQKPLGLDGLCSFYAVQA